VISKQKEGGTRFW